MVRHLCVTYEPRLLCLQVWRRPTRPCASCRRRRCCITSTARSPRCGSVWRAAHPFSAHACRLVLADHGPRSSCSGGRDASHPAAPPAQALWQGDAPALPAKHFSRRGGSSRRVRARWLAARCHRPTARGVQPLVVALLRIGLTNIQFGRSTWRSSTKTWTTWRMQTATPTLMRCAVVPLLRTRKECLIFHLLASQDALFQLEETAGGEGATHRSACVSFVPNVTFDMQLPRRR